MADFRSPYTAFQYDALAFQMNAFQIFGVDNGYATVSIVEIRPVYASVANTEPGLTLARVSIVEIST
jgi:hypothetical protein